MGLYSLRVLTKYGSLCLIAPNVPTEEGKTVAKIKRSEELESLPKGVYKGVLTAVNTRDNVPVKQAPGKVTSQFIWVFTGEKVKGKNGTRVTWSDVEGEAVALTNQSYGNKQASLTAFLPKLLQGANGVEAQSEAKELADRFMDTVGDTDHLLGWRGIFVVEEGDGGKTYAANFQADSEWLSVWSANMTGDPKYLAKPTTTAPTVPDGRPTSDPDDDFSDPFAE